MLDKLCAAIALTFYLQLYFKPILLSKVDLEERFSNKCGEGFLIKDVSGNTTCLCYTGWGGKYCTSCMGILRVRLHKGNLTSGFNDGSLLHRSCIWLFEGLPKYSYITLHVATFSIACQLSTLALQSSSSPLDAPIAFFSGELMKNSTLGSFQVDDSGRAVLFYQESEMQSLFNQRHFALSYELSTCPFNCSGHGYCIESARHCKCLPGWMGLGCQLSHEMMSIDHVYSRLVNVSVGRPITGHVMLKLKQANQFLLVGGTDLSLQHTKTNGVLQLTQVELADINNSSNIEVKSKAIYMNKKIGNATVPPCLFEHSAIIIEETLWLTGGRFCGARNLSDRVWYIHLDELYEDGTWSYLKLPPDIGGISGHITAWRKTNYSSQLLLLFGYSSKRGWMLPHKLLSLNLSNFQWEWSTTHGSTPPRRYGAAADQWKDKLRVHGGWGFTRLQTVFLADTYNLQLDRLIWHEMHPTGRPQALHSMIHLSDDSDQFLLLGGYQCKGECLVQSLVLWSSNLTEEALLSPGIARFGFGAAAISFDNIFRILIHGGFHSNASADLILLDTTNATWRAVTANCSWWTSCQACQDADCSWNPIEGCQMSALPKSVCPKLLNDKCSQLKSCLICQEAGCKWQRLNDGSAMCVELETAAAGGESVINCQSCSENKDCFSCLNLNFSSTDECVWCPLYQLCLQSSVAAGALSHYGECTLRLRRPNKQSSLLNVCARHNCSHFSTCEDCTSQALCGWCSLATGLGKCFSGTVSGPVDDFQLPRSGKCFGSGTTWNYGQCPQCQCNGHGQCAHGSSSCYCDPKTLTRGRQCEHCVTGAYFNGSGSPRDGSGLPCVKCPCRGRASQCNSPNGNCEPYCSTPGTIGLRCDRCSSIQRHGLPVFLRLGDRCYQLLRVNYKLEVGGSNFDLGYIKRFNFLARPLYSNRDLRIEVECSRGAAIMDLLYLTEPDWNTARLSASRVGTVRRRQTCSHGTRWRVTLRGQKGDYEFARYPNLTFLIHVYFNSSIELGIIIVQEPTLDLVRFFIIFITCFAALLSLAAIFWKMKQRYDQFRRAQRHKAKEQRMAARPYAMASLVLDGSPNVAHLSSISLQPLTTSPQRFSFSSDLVMTCIMQLPGPRPVLCLGSALVHSSVC